MAVLTTTFKGIDLLSGILKDMAKNGDNLAKVMENISSQAERTFSSSQQAADRANQAFTNLGQDAQQAGQKAQQAGAAADQAGNGIRNAGKAAKEAAGGIGGLDINLQNLMGAFMALTAGKQIFDTVAGGIREVTIAFADFESAITGIFKTVEGTPGQLAAITEGVRMMSRGMPAAATEIAAVCEAAGQLGIATNNILGFSRVMLDLGNTTDLSSTSAAASLAKFANITRMSAGDYSRLGSVIVDLGNNFAATESSIVTLGTRLASAASLAGFTEPQIMALATAMTSVGVEAEAGGSSMSQLINMMQLAAETGAGLEDFARVANMSAEEFKTAWGEDAAGALYAFIAGLNDTARLGASTTATLDAMGITEIRLSNTVRALAQDHTGLAKALKTGDAAWRQNTALTKEAGLRYGTLESKIQVMMNAFTELKAALGEALAPVVVWFVELLTKITQGMADFARQNPIVARTLMTVVVAIGATIAAILVLTAVAKALGITLAALNSIPIVLAITAIVAAIAAVVSLVSSLTAAQREYDSFTGATKQAADALKASEADYERIVAQDGELSKAALDAKAALEEQRAEFEANKMTMEEYSDAVNELINSTDDMWASFKTSNRDIERAGEQRMALIEEMQTLANKGNLSAQETVQLRMGVDLIVEDLPELSSLLNNKGLPEGDFFKMAFQASGITALEDQIKNAEASLESFYKKQEELSSMKDFAKDELDFYQNAFNNASGWDQYWDVNKVKSNLETAQTEYDKIIAKEAQWNEKIGETEGIIASLSGQIGDIEVEEFNSLSFEDQGLMAAQDAFYGVSEGLLALGEAYLSAYDAAQQSMLGQIDLLKEFEAYEPGKKDPAVTAENMFGNLESYKTAFEEYGRVLGNLREMGFSDTALGFAGGDAFSSENLAKLQALEDGANGAADGVKAYADSWNNMAAATEGATMPGADLAAKVATQFEQSLDEFTQLGQQAIEQMGLEAQAGEEGKKSIAKLISEFGTGVNEVAGKGTEAGQAFMKAIQNAMDSYKLKMPTLKANISVNVNTTQGVEGNAKGTTSSAYAFVAGERGPELIIGAPGSTVFPKDETDKIVSAVSGMTPRVDNIIPFTGTWNDGLAAVNNFGLNAPQANNMIPFPEGGGQSLPIPDRQNAQSPGGDMTLKKHIVLELAGNGVIEVKGETDPDVLWAMLSPQLKEIVLEMIDEDDYVEGDGTYGI